MSINNIKGTLYDLLGYFAPGFIGLIGGYLIMINDGKTQNVYKEC